MGLHHFTDYTCGTCGEYYGTDGVPCDVCGTEYCSNCILHEKSTAGVVKEILSEYTKMPADKEIDYHICEKCKETHFHPCIECNREGLEQQCTKCEKYVCRECWKLNSETPVCWNCLKSDILQYLLQKSNRSEQEILDEYYDSKPKTKKRKMSDQEQSKQTKIE